MKKYLTDEDRESILSFLEEDDIIYLSLIDECNIINLHHTLGQNIRNYFGLWEKYKDGDEHPDDISYQMIVELCKYLRDKNRTEHIPRFGVPLLVQVIHNNKVEDGRIISSFMRNDEIIYKIELIDKKFHTPCTIIERKDSDNTVISK